MSLIDYEEGKLNHEEKLKLFQWLVDTGLAWSLQGSYGREAMRLIESGEVHAAGGNRGRGL